MNGRISIIAGEDLVASVPLVRILNRVRLDIPTIVVPVHIHSTQRLFCIENRLPRTILRLSAPGLYIIRDIKVHQFSIPILEIFKKLSPTLALGLPDATPRIRILKSWRNSRNRFAILGFMSMYHKF